MKNCLSCLILVGALFGCSSQPVMIRHTEILTIPDDYLVIPEKPKANLPENATQADVAKFLVMLNAWGNQLRNNLQRIQDYQNKNKGE